MTVTSDELYDVLFRAHVKQGCTRPTDITDTLVVQEHHDKLLVLQRQEPGGINTMVTMILPKDATMRVMFSVYLYLDMQPSPKEMLNRILQLPYTLMSSLTSMKGGHRVPWEILVPSRKAEPPVMVVRHLDGSKPDYTIPFAKYDRHMKHAWKFEVRSTPGASALHPPVYDVRALVDPRAQQFLLSQQRPERARVQPPSASVGQRAYDALRAMS